MGVAYLTTNPKIKALCLLLSLQNFLISWCENFVKRNSFCMVSGDSPETMRKLFLSTKFPHQEIRWNYGIFCSECIEKIVSKWLWKGYLSAGAEKIGIIGESFTIWNFRMSFKEQKFSCFLKVKSFVAQTYAIIAENRKIWESIILQKLSF